MKLIHLYPREMNIYGDTGNVLVLRRRLQWRHLPVEVVPVSVGDPLPSDADVRPVATALMCGTRQPVRSSGAPTGDVAQLAEHCLCKAGVRGSIPLVSTHGRAVLAESASFAFRVSSGGRAPRPPRCGFFSNQRGWFGW